MFGAEPDLLCERCAEGVRQRTAPSATGRLMDVLGSGRAPFTLAVIAVTVVIFVAGKMYHTSPSGWAAWVFRLTMVERTAEGAVVALPIDEPWRLLTAAFLHLGFLHILFNLWWIWDLGRAIEWRRGPVVTAALILGSAVSANALQWLFGGPGVGLSGVVYALAGFLFTRRKHDPLAAAIMDTRTTRFLLAWLVLCVILTQTGAFPIGNWAHGGGAAWGVAAGFASRGRFRFLWMGLLTLATAGLVLWVMQGRVYW